MAKLTCAQRLHALAWLCVSLSTWPGDVWREIKRGCGKPTKEENGDGN